MRSLCVPPCPLPRNLLLLSENAALQESAAIKSLRHYRICNLNETKQSMKTTLPILAVLAFATVLQPNDSTAAPIVDFVYGYKTVLSANADEYVVGIQNVRKYDEGTPGASYWAPISNGVIGLLTQKFVFSAPTTAIYHYSQLASYNFGGGNYGATSLWGSTDGSSWQLLLDNPTPVSIDSYVYYDQNLPNSLVGTDALWLQTRFLSHGWTIMAQSTHAGQGNSFNMFQLNANLAPEPTSLALLVVSASFMLSVRRRRTIYS